MNKIQLYTSVPVQTLSIGPYHFKSGTLRFIDGKDEDGNLETQFLGLLESSPWSIKNMVKKIDDSAADRIAQEFLDQRARVQRGASSAMSNQAEAALARISTQQPGSESLVAQPVQLPPNEELPKSPADTSPTPPDGPNQQRGDAPMAGSQPDGTGSAPSNPVAGYSSIEQGGEPIGDVVDGGIPSDVPPRAIPDRDAEGGPAGEKDRPKLTFGNRSAE